MKLYRSILLFFFITYPLLAHSLVRIKNVSQTGLDSNTGQIRIELNDNYNASASMSFKSDHVEILVPEAFVIPVRREFRASSSKSSVLKMEASQIPGNSVNIQVFFRVPMETVKRTAKLSKSGKMIILTYKLKETATKQASAATVAAPVIEKEEEKQTKTIIKENLATTKTEKTINDERVTDSELTSTIKTEKTNFFWIFVRMIFSLIFVLGLLFVGVFVVKKYFNKLPGMSSLVSHSKIKIVSTFSLAPGRTLYIIDVLGEKMLIAATKENISMLAVLGEGNFAEDVDQAMSNDNEADSDFKKSEQNLNIKSRIKSELKERLRSIKG